MEKIKSTVITKRIKKGFFGKETYMLGLRFHDIYFMKNGGNTKEMKVSYIIYQELDIGDEILCPMIHDGVGLTFDFSKPIEKN